MTTLPRKYEKLDWGKTSYPGVKFSEDSDDQQGDRLRYFNLSKGSVIPNHNHLSYEKIVILSGLVKFLNEELSEADILYMKKGQEHSAVALEDTLMLVINERL